MNSLRRKLYVQNYDGFTVSIIDLGTNQVIKALVVGGTPNAGYYCRKADKFYSAGKDNQCVVISGLTDTIVRRISMPGIDGMLSATGNEQAGIVFTGMLEGNSGYIAAIDAEADTVLHIHYLGHACAQGLLYSPKSSYVYSANYPNSVDVLAGDGSRVIEELPLGDAPFVLASAPSHDRVYVGNLGTSCVYVLRDNEAVSASPRPESCGVLSATPNPFTRTLSVVWNILTKGSDVARVYAQDGGLVRQTRIPHGVSRWVWDGLDDSGATLPPGVYVLEAGPGVRAKVVKLK